jgi:uncharacterized protein YdaU (DUF1376 family)
MPLYVEKFLADTAHLSAEQCGAYINLLCTMWRSNDGTLPNDAEMLTRVSKVHPPHWKRVWKAITSLFDIDNGRVTSIWLQAELGKANAIIVTRRAAGSLGGQTKQFKRVMERYGRPMNASHGVIKTAPNPLKNNDVGGSKCCSKRVANYNYNIKEEEERSGEPRPETGSPSLEEGLQKEAEVVLFTPQPASENPISDHERKTNLAKLSVLRRKLTRGE